MVVKASTAINIYTTSLILTACFLVPPSFSAETQQDARQLTYWWQPSPSASDFYNEVKVERSTNGSYFCVCGFSHGYFGLQQLVDGRKVAIFSVWDPSDPTDLTARLGDVPVDRHVQILYCDPAVKTQRFGGEGTGQQSFYQFDWDTDRTYKFLVKAKPYKERTAYAAYLFDPRLNSWKHLATFATLARGDLIHGPYSFVEAFTRDGRSTQQARSAHFSNGWMRAVDGHWLPITQASFEATASPLTNIDAWTDSSGFGLATGGQTKNTHLKVTETSTAVTTSARPPSVENLD